MNMQQNPLYKLNIFKQKMYANDIILTINISLKLQVNILITIAEI